MDVAASEFFEDGKYDLDFKVKEKDPKVTNQLEISNICRTSRVAKSSATCTRNLLRNTQSSGILFSSLF